MKCGVKVPADRNIANIGAIKRRGRTPKARSGGALDAPVPGTRDAAPMASAAASSSAPAALAAAGKRARAAGAGGGSNGRGDGGGRGGGR